MDTLGRSPAAPPVAPDLGARRWLWGVGLLTAGAFAASVALAPPAGASPVRGLTWLLFVGSSVHVASTGWLYTVPEVRSYARMHRARFVWIPAALVVGSAAVAAVLPPATLTWLLLPYFAWQFFHFQKQNLGMAALAASGSRVPSLRPAERKALIATGCLGIAGLLVHPDLLQLDVDTGARVLFPVAGVLFAVACLIGIAVLARRPASDRPAGFTAVYLVSLLFPLPIFVFGSPYAAVGGMAITHGLQYLVLVGMLASAGERGTPRWVRMALFFNIALIGGAALSAASHLHGAQPAGRMLYGAYLGAVMAHFVVDAGIWRLRDAFPRQFLSARLPFLVSTTSPAAATAPAAR